LWPCVLELPSVGDLGREERPSDMSEPLEISESAIIAVKRSGLLKKHKSGVFEWVKICEELKYIPSLLHTAATQNDSGGGLFDRQCGRITVIGKRRCLTVAISKGPTATFFLSPSI
jgi:hypothetical protein